MKPFTCGNNHAVPGVPYVVSIVAVNRAGAGKDSTRTIFTKELS